LSRTLPELGGMKAARIFSSVDFPHPLRPKIQMSSPLATVKSIFSRTRKQPPFTWKTFPRPRISNSGFSVRSLFWAEMTVSLGFTTFSWHS
jgi:hypothetical protein